VRFTTVPTIKEVAKAAKVSTATVSRIVNGVAFGYSAETKAKVLTVIDELGYTPNTIARTMITRKSCTIGVLLPDLISMFSSCILEGVETAAAQARRNVVISHTESKGHRTMDYLRVMAEKRVDGIIFVSEVLRPEYRDFVLRRSIPLVLLATEAPGSEIPFVKVNDEKAAFDGTAFLLGLGHKGVAMISGSKDDQIAGVPRIRGYRRAMEEKEAGGALPPLVIDAEGFRFEDIVCVEGAIDDALHEYSAFFCASDELAAGLLNYALRRGLRVPEDLSILGFDDLPITTMVTPALSTVKQPLRELGILAAEMIVDIQEGAPPGGGRYLPHQVIARESTSTRKG
jgi:LacI family transcriptional regulator